MRKLVGFAVLLLVTSCPPSPRPQADGGTLQPSPTDGGSGPVDGGTSPTDGGTRPVEPKAVLVHDPSDTFFLTKSYPSPIEPVTLKVRVQTGKVQSVSARVWDGRWRVLPMKSEADATSELFSVIVPASSRPKFYQFSAQLKDGSQVSLAKGGVVTTAPPPREAFSWVPAESKGRVVHYDTGFTKPQVHFDSGSGAFATADLFPETPGRFGAMLEVARDADWELVFHQGDQWDNPPGGGNYRTRFNELWVRGGVVYDVDPDSMLPGIIDAHTHAWGGDGTDLLSILKDANVAYALSSTSGGITVQTKLSQLGAANESIVPLRWFDPRSESAETVERDVVNLHFSGLKLHPYATATPADDPKLDAFAEICERHDIPMVIHAAVDETSSPGHIANLALRHPRARFIMYHVELGAGDKTYAVAQAARSPNIALETSWANIQSIEMAVAKLGAYRVMFGTDAITDNVGHYKNKYIGDERGDNQISYVEEIARLKKDLSAEQFQQWSTTAAVNWFHLRLLPPADRLDTDGDGAPDVQDSAPVDPAKT